MNLPDTILLAVFSTFISLSMIHGLFPPSSSVIGVKFFAASLATIYPTLVLTVKKI